MMAQLAKGRDDHQLAGAAQQLAVLKLPGGMVRDEDGIQARLERRIDVTAGTVADHPAVRLHDAVPVDQPGVGGHVLFRHDLDRKSTRLNSSHVRISYAVFCLKKKKKTDTDMTM